MASPSTPLNRSQATRIEARAHLLALRQERIKKRQISRGVNVEADIKKVPDTAQPSAAPTAHDDFSDDVAIKQADPDTIESISAPAAPTVFEDPDAVLTPDMSFEDRVADENGTDAFAVSPHSETPNQADAVTIEGGDDDGQISEQTNVLNETAISDELDTALNSPSPVDQQGTAFDTSDPDTFTSIDVPADIDVIQTQDTMSVPPVVDADPVDLGVETDVSATDPVSEDISVGSSSLPDPYQPDEIETATPVELESSDQAEVLEADAPVEEVDADPDVLLPAGQDTILSDAPDLDAGEDIQPTAETAASQNLDPVLAPHVPIDAEADALGALPFAGPGLIWMLSRVGITSLEDLAQADAATLTADMGVVGEVIDLAFWIEEAQRMIAPTASS